MIEIFKLMATSFSRTCGELHTLAIWLIRTLVKELKQIPKLNRDVRRASCKQQMLAFHDVNIYMVFVVNNTFLMAS